LRYPEISRRSQRQITNRSARPVEEDGLVAAMKAADAMVKALRGT
jgi:hypothetical protein